VACKNCACDDCTAQRDPVAQMRAWCAANKVPVLVGDVIRETDVAAILQVSIKTLRNERCLGAGLPVVRIRNRVHHRVEDVVRQMGRFVPD
jgi:hypothetical protein